MHISGSILITAAFVSAMLILQESSATAQTCEQTQHDTCFAPHAACCTDAGYYGRTWQQCDHARPTPMEPIQNA